MEQTDKTKILNTVFMMSLLVCVLIRGLPLLAAFTDIQMFRETIIIAVYSVSLLLPTAAGNKIMKADTVITEKKKFHFPLIWIFIAMGAITVSAYLNYVLVLPFETAGIIGNSQYIPEIGSVTELLFLILSSAVIPPITEEIFFRGFALKKLLPLGNTGAILISAAIFSLFHGNIGQLLYTFAAGVVFGYIYILTGSVLPCIIIHGINNGYSVIIIAISSFCSEAAAGLFSLIFDGIFLLGGIISLIYILVKRCRDKKFGALTDYHTEGIYNGFPIIAIIYAVYAAVQIIYTNFI